MNPDGPRLDWLLQYKIAATKLLAELEKKLLLQEQHALRETSAGNVRFFEGMVSCFSWWLLPQAINSPSEALNRPLDEKKAQSRGKLWVYLYSVLLSYILCYVRWKTEGWHSRTSPKLDILSTVCSQWGEARFMWSHCDGLTLLSFSPRRSFKCC